MNIYLKIYNLLSPTEKKKAIYVVLLTLVMGLVDAVGAASIMPFLSLVGNPQIINTNKLLQFLKQISGIQTNQEFTFFVGICVFLILVFSLSIKAITLYAQVKFSMLRDFSFGRKLLILYLSQPYSWYLNKNSAELGKNILGEVNDVVKNALLPLLNLISGVIVFITMAGLMLIVEPKLAILISGTFLICYLLIYKTIKKFITKIGKSKFNANKDRYQIINEVFRAIKEVKISNLESKFIKRYSNPALIHAQSNSKAKLAASLPRFALEIVAFGGMFLVILYLLRTYKDINYILPTIGLYAYAGYRILPSLQTIYQSISTIKYATPSIENLSNDFRLYNENLKINKNKSNRLIFPKKNIVLENINFKFPSKQSNILKNIDINIEANSITGFVGFTGSGKTTLVDIILGLLEPEKGNLKIDDEVLKKEDFYYWQRAIGYVPQNIYITDESVECNIAFESDLNIIDNKRIEEVAKIAQIHDFIINELPNQYKTKVGDRGIRLSGGQKQRLGIARALYKNPKFLILDEATSALDNITEKKLMKNIYKLNKEITIIIIAHRLTTLENCDKIFLLEEGKIIDSGSYIDLYESSNLFRKMVNTDINS